MMSVLWCIGIYLSHSTTITKKAVEQVVMVFLRTALSTIAKKMQN